MLDFHPFGKNAEEIKSEYTPPGNLLIFKPGKPIKLLPSQRVVAGYRY